MVGCAQVRIGQIGGMSNELVQPATILPSTHMHAQPASAAAPIIVAAISARSGGASALTIASPSKRRPNDPRRR
jgi:hypothetical protein